MIVMLISDESKVERQYIVRFSKDLAARQTEESWQMIECAAIPELVKAVRDKIRTDIICVDITIPKALELTMELRKNTPSAYIILIASPSISPMTYMRPSIGAESLMLKPLTREQIQEVLSEALGTYIRRFYKPDENKVFVLENKGGRDLIDYENIYFFESREKRVFLNTGVREYGFYDTLEQLEERLMEGFIRCHRSFLVNRNKIEKIFLSQNRLLLKDDFEIPLSRTYKPRLKEFMARGDI
ncbi:LytR/AlgR family response regulator transcription factor [Frisingicoccus sp.]|uniref:LytR/AlgR family response regulator transcription factor n=1 Tax=Frisingicoccus sp. TaxID=1918627 RepID=UPI003AB6C863